MSDIMLTTEEKYKLISTLGAEIKWLHGYGGGREEHVEVATRLLALAESLPFEEQGDA